ncbi:MAG: acyltransferase [Desulfotignum sp.]
MKKRNSKDRRFELDWLRVMAILIVFLYHSTRFFNLEDWHVKNADVYVSVEIWNVFVTRWMMPLFFMISGASLFYAVGKSGGWKRFYTDKLLRLFVPVLFTSVTHGALQVYLERVSHGRFAGSFLDYLPTCFSGIYTGIGLAVSGNFANVGMHLWYLLFLFVYSLICYRLFVWLKAGGHKVLAGLTNLLAVPGTILIGFTIPLALMKTLIPPAFLEVGNGGWGFLYYLWFLIAGFLVVSNERLIQSIHTQRWFFFILGVALSVCHLYLLFGVAYPALQGKGGDWIAALLSYFSAWCWVLAILGFAIGHLSFEHPFLRQANEGVLPFFILHQTVLLFFGYFIMSWEIYTVLKWLLVFTFSFVVIVAVYVVLIQNFDVLRFLFGMKTSHPFYQVFQKKTALILLPLIWLGLSTYAGLNQKMVLGQERFPMSLEFDRGHDLVFNTDSITGQSTTGVKVVEDQEASIGSAFELVSGGSQSIAAEPNVYVDIQFLAPAGRYFVWIRGKSDVDSELTDSVWLQVDNQVGTRKGSVHLGNWNTFHPVGVYAWGSDVHIPYIVLLKHNGTHIIRIQPRQIPHRIDQIWLSRTQYRIPNTSRPIR